MNSSELLQAAVKKIKRYKIIILAAGILFALLAFMYANGKRTSYTSKATLFPLLSPSDNTISNSMLQGILGINDAPKSFSNEATINIIELVQSRRIRESVVTTRLPDFETPTCRSGTIFLRRKHDSWPRPPSRFSQRPSARAAGSCLVDVMAW